MRSAGAAVPMLPGTYLAPMFESCLFSQIVWYHIIVGFSASTDVAVVHLKRQGTSSAMSAAGLVEQRAPAAGLKKVAKPGWAVRSRLLLTEVFIPIG